MLNIKYALSQMRIARKLGKLSNEQQTRCLRKLGDTRTEAWHHMRALLAQIEKEVHPQLMAKRIADHELFQVKYEPEDVKAPVAA